MTNEVRKKKSNQATILGVFTSLLIALEVMDWDNLDWGLPSTYFKLLSLSLPAIGGYLSQVK